MTKAVSKGELTFQRLRARRKALCFSQIPADVRSASQSHKRMMEPATMGTPGDAGPMQECSFTTVGPLSGRIPGKGTAHKGFSSIQDKMGLR